MVSFHMRCMRLDQVPVTVIVAVTADEVVAIRFGFLKRPCRFKQRHGSGKGNNAALVFQPFPVSAG